MIKPLKEIKNKDKILYHCTIKQQFYKGMWYGYIEGKLVTKTYTKQSCLNSLDRYCKEKVQIARGEIDLEEKKLKRLFKLKYNAKTNKI